MSLRSFFIKFFASLALFSLPCQVNALSIDNPDEIKVPGLAVADNISSAAILEWKGHEMLVTKGYRIGTNLEVHNITGDSVVLYRPNLRKFYVIEPMGELVESPLHNVITTENMPVWKIVKLAAAAHRKDYICSCQTNSYNKVRHHSENLNDMMTAIVSPNHRFHLRDGVIYASPVHLDNKGWEQFGKLTKHFKSRRLKKYFPNLEKKGSIVANGKPLDQAIQDIALKTRTKIVWNKPEPVPLYCTFKDRPWHEILSTIIFFNGFSLSATADGIVIHQ